MVSIKPAPSAAAVSLERHSHSSELPPVEIRYMLNFLDGMFPKLQDRRVFPRWSYVAGMSLATPEGDVRQVHTYDLNPYNAGFVATAPVAIGQHVAIRMDLPNGGRFETRARVMRCREFAPGCYEGYVNFSDSLPEDTAAATRPPQK